MTPQEDYLLDALLEKRQKQKQAQQSGTGANKQKQAQQSGTGANKQKTGKKMSIHRLRQQVVFVLFIWTCAIIYDFAINVKIIAQPESNSIGYFVQVGNDFIFTCLEKLFS